MPSSFVSESSAYMYVQPLAVMPSCKHSSLPSSPCLLQPLCKRQDCSCATTQTAGHVCHACRMPPWALGEQDGGLTWTHAV